MSLSDCVIATSLEIIDSSMTPGAVTLSPAVLTQGGIQISALGASWIAISNPYVTGVQFEYQPVDGSAPAVQDTQRAPNTTWMGYAGVVSAKPYSVRYRAAGAPGLFGNWIGPFTVSGGIVVAPKPATPLIGSWSAMGTTTTANGVSTPAITVSGALDTTGVTDIEILFAPHGGATFTSFGKYPSTRTGFVVDSVASAQAYDIGIVYWNGTTASDMLLLNNSGAGYTAGTFAGSAATTDVTPAAMDWTDQTASGTGTQTTTTNIQTVSSINAPITLNLTYTNTASWAYIKNGAAPVSFASGGQVTVSVGDTLAFQCASSATVTSVLTVVNHTDADTTLDTTSSAITVTSTDVHADPVTWSNVAADSYASSPSSGTFGDQAITGINVPVSITPVLSGAAILSYRRNYGIWTTIPNGTPVTANPGDILGFQAERDIVGTESGTLTIKNTTDSSTVLSTPTYRLQVHTGPWP